MDRPRSRFVQGRGGRPYFYFRRNGKVIPAGGQNDGDDEPGPSKYAGRGGRGRGRGGGGAGSRGGAGGRGRGAAAGGGGTQTQRDENLDTSQLHPQYYAAPNDESEVMSYGVIAPPPFPGWQLYFHKEAFEPDSELVRRIKVAETFYINNLARFDLIAIQREYYFPLDPSVLVADNAVLKEWPTIAKDLATCPQRTLATLGLAMYSLIHAATSAAALEPEECTEAKYVPRISDPPKIFVRLVDFNNARKMCDIKNELLDTLYCVRGIVTAMGDVEACASWIAFKCPRCGQEQTLKQRGVYRSQPYCCKKAGCLAKKGFIEYRSSPHTRITPKQIIRLRESNIQACEEELYAYVDVELRYDLVDAIVPGQEVIAIGILKMRPLVDNVGYQKFNATKKNANACEIFLKAVSLTDAKHVKHVFNERDLNAITTINSEPDSFKLLVHSVAPELHGHEMAKAGVLLSLLGGAGNQLDNDDDEINVLLVGDPGMGKSHMLRMCAEISPKCSLVSSKRGCTIGQQLTATVKCRQGSSIDAGALISSFNGHCCIDDLERQGAQQDHIFQVLQTRTVSLMQQDVYATLNAPIAVIATANSSRGHYDQSKRLADNIRVSAPLLNEFHLIYVLMDRPNKDMDTSLTEHIRALHAGLKKSTNIAARFAMKPQANSSISTSEADEGEFNENYDLGNRLRLHFNGVDEETLDLLPPALVKKFIGCARQQVRPLLDDNAIDDLRKFYFDLRQQQNVDQTVVISTSHLEALIRLTQARARLDFASVATRLHVRDVLALVRHSFADLAVGDYVDLNPATAVLGNAKKTQRGMTKKFVQMLQTSNRRMYDMNELKALGKQLGINEGIPDIVDAINFQGYLLKKGPNLYEVMAD